MYVCQSLTYTYLYNIHTSLKAHKILNSCLEKWKSYLGAQFEGIFILKRKNVIFSMHCYCNGILTLIKMIGCEIYNCRLNKPITCFHVKRTSNNNTLVCWREDTWLVHFSGNVINSENKLPLFCLYNKGGRVGLLELLLVSTLKLQKGKNCLSSLGWQFIIHCLIP